MSASQTRSDVTHLVHIVNIRSPTETLALALRVLPVLVKRVKLVENDGRVAVADTNQLLEVFALDAGSRRVARWSETGFVYSWTYGWT
jgi:hypothetical protein